MNITTQRKNAKEFVARWLNRGSERSDAQSFWIDLFHTILGIDNPVGLFDFEKKVPLKTKQGTITNDFIDAYVKDTHVVIEQKGSAKSLTKKYKQSDGTMLTPYQQAKKYYDNIPYSERGQFIVTSNFKEIRIYDLDQPLPEDHARVLELSDLAKSPTVLNFLVDVGQDRIFKEKKVSLAAGDLVAKIYDELLKQYPHPDTPETQKSINQLCVRIVFCLYAEDAGIFGKKNAFHDYLVDFKVSEMRDALNRLFEVLNTKDENRSDGDVYYSIQEHKKLGEFPYVNGGMFAGRIDIPNFTEELRTLILRDASDNFDWSQISPTIFGAVFESTLNADERRKNGMHYTSIENIHKVIDPLFLNDLKKELADIEKVTGLRRKMNLAEKFQEKLSHLTFFDPACGSGNFLTESYLQLRELENEAIKIQHPNPMLDVGQARDYIKVSIQQFYGIELNDFAVSVAKTAMWIAESQMWEKTKDIIYAEGDFLPLKTYVHIHEGDALTMDWNDVVDKSKCSYIIGNPPFVGYSKQTKVQKANIQKIYIDNTGKKLKNSGRIDFVAGWFYKASKYIYNTDVRVAFVSTSSITQGDQATSVWKPLYDMFKIHINFAYRAFQWNSEAKQQAQVFVVIVGFSFDSSIADKIIYDGTRVIHAKNINQYLLNAPTIFITGRKTPVCKSPLFMGGLNYGDGGHYQLTKSETDELLAKEPLAKKYIHPYLTAKNLVHGKLEYCLWFANAKPNELRSLPMVMLHIQEVKQYRSNLNGQNMRKYASRPLQPIRSQYYSCSHQHNSLAIPLTFSDKQYVPMAIIDKNVICSKAVDLLDNPSNYLFGILISSVHSAWMKTLCNRLGNGFGYSNTLIYNNFPWPPPTPEQKQKIEATAQAILDARKNYPDSSLADLYDPLTMPADLLKAHKENDKAVLSAYGLPANATESEIVAHLFKMYEELTKGENNESR